jgi:hypothetical protein
MRLFRRDISSRPTEARVSPTWLAWPTLSAGGGGQIKTAGTNHYEDDLRATLARTGRLVMAELLIETTGKYAGAVRVYVAGTELGAIPHAIAADFRTVVERVREAGDVPTCRAELDADAEPYVDVWLSAAPRERSDDEPFLPPMSGARVNVAEDELGRLNEMLGTRARSKRVVRIGTLEERDRGWALMLDGRELGRLPQATYTRVIEARDAGFPLSCRVRIIRAPERTLRVEADFPTCA